MERYELTQDEVAEITGYTLDTVKAWCTSDNSERYRPMIDRAWRLYTLGLDAFLARRTGGEDD